MYAEQEEEFLNEDDGVNKGLSACPRRVDINNLKTENQVIPPFSAFSV